METKKKDQSNFGSTVQSNRDSKIPYPSLESWMLSRCELPNLQELEYPNEKKYNLGNYLISILLKRTRSAKRRWLLLRIITKVFKIYFKIVNRLEIKGKKNIPDRGIFIINHPGSLDPFIFLSSIEKPVGCFVGYDNYWLTGMAMRFLHFINRSHFRKLHPELRRKILMELMVRNVLQKNAYFAIWPEGTLSDGRRIRKGYSSVVKLYAVLNSKKNIIPFIPVLIKGGECYSYHENPSFIPKPKKITLEFLEPYFLPREWLKKPEDGGKTPREVIDFLMLELAKKNGQKSLAENHVLNKKKERYAEMSKLK